MAWQKRVRALLGLLVLALAAYVLDLLLRRVRIFEKEEFAV